MKKYFAIIIGVGVLAACAPFGDQCDPGYVAEPLPVPQNLYAPPQDVPAPAPVPMAAPYLPPPAPVAKPAPTARAAAKPAAKKPAAKKPVKKKTVAKPKPAPAAQDACPPVAAPADTEEVVVIKKVIYQKNPDGTKTPIRTEEFVPKQQ
ncbi:MAG: hypothetical protein FWC61_03365 [Proteobacteria bacterium]|nr:hypothetical protein [Pseudomonadota bacterium]